METPDEFFDRTKHQSSRALKTLGHLNLPSPAPSDMSSLKVSYADMEARLPGRAMTEAESAQFMAEFGPQMLASDGEA